MIVGLLLFAVVRPTLCSVQCATLTVMSPCVAVGSRNSTWNGRPRRAVRKAGSIGGSRMMECEIAYPDGRFVQHIISWHKQGDEVAM